MSKEYVRRLNGVITAVFHHTGYISKEDAQDISGLDDGEFEKVFAKADAISRQIIAARGNKVDAFIAHLAREIDDLAAHGMGGLFRDEH